MIGAACLDPILRKKLYENPVNTAHTYGFYVDDVDADILKAIFAKSAEIEMEFLNVQNRICHRPPCLLPPGSLTVIGAALLNKPLLDELFGRDPIQSLNNRGFSLTFTDRYVLTALISGGEKEAELKQALEALHKKISSLIPTVMKKAA